MNIPTCRVLVLAIICLWTSSPIPLRAGDSSPASERMPIGMNFSGIADYVPGFPFKNLMWGARAWKTRNADGSGPFQTDLEAKMSYNKQGYPTEIPFRPEGVDSDQMVFTIIPNTTEPGRYVLLYEGDGEIVPVMTTKFLSSEPGRIEMDLNVGKSQSDYEGIGIKSSSKESPIRNIRILRLEDEKADLAANPFREDFLEYAKQWHVLRYLNWTFTNNSLESEWADRKPMDFYTMIGLGGDAIGRWGEPASEFRRMYSGVPLEIIIQLSNMTKTNPWFNLPHLATSEYLTEFAKMVKEKLDPSLTFYVEHSNEVWNWHFQQAIFMIGSKKAAEGLDPAVAWKGGEEPSEFPYFNGTVAKDGGAGHPERMGVLARRVFQHFEDVFTGDDRKRMVRVLGTQQAWPDVSRRMVAWVMKNGGADALSPAAYIPPDKEAYEKWTAAGASLTGAQVLEDMERIFATKIRPNAEQQAQIAKDNNLRLIIYEGGQHIQPKGQKETDYMPGLKEAQFLPGMYDLIKKNIELQRELGAALFCAYSSTTYQGTRIGSFGHSETFNPPLEEAPKLRALKDLNLPR